MLMAASPPPRPLPLHLSQIAHTVRLICDARLPLHLGRKNFSAPDDGGLRISSVRVFPEVESDMTALMLHFRCRALLCDARSTPAHPQQPFQIAAVSLHWQTSISIVPENTAARPPWQPSRCPPRSLAKHGKRRPTVRVLSLSPCRLPPPQPRCPDMT
jgi:hypothetical protein